MALRMTPGRTLDVVLVCQTSNRNSYRSTRQSVDKSSLSVNRHRKLGMRFTWSSRRCEIHLVSMKIEIHLVISMYNRLSTEKLPDLRLISGEDCVHVPSYSIHKEIKRRSTVIVYALRKIVLVCGKGESNISLNILFLTGCFWFT